MRLLLTLLLTLAFQSASAQIIAVRSGEHGDFTRLVFDVPAETTWTLAPNTETNFVRLTLDRSISGYNTSLVFDKINKDRVLGMVPLENSSSIDIHLACDCFASGFLLRNSMLVIDIKNNVVNSNVSAKDTAAQPQTDLSKLWLGDGARIGPLKRDTSLSTLNLPVFSEQLEGFPAVNEEARSAEVSAQVRGQVFVDVASAATQGLLDPSQSLGRPTRRAEFDLNDIDAQNTVGTIRLDDEVERDFSEKGRVSIGGRQCTQSHTVDLSKWGEDQSEISLLLATRRGAMFGEFDRINKNALISYVQSLLFFGFGAEARSVLITEGGNLDPALLALSYLIDGESDPSQYFASQLNCESYSVMWAVLDGQNLLPSSVINDSFLLQAFEILPKHLKLHVGPLLAQKLTNSGFTGVAKSLLRRLERSTGHETESILLGKAQLDLLEGNQEQANAALSQLSISDGPETASAIAAKVELARESGERVPERIVELSGAYSTELRNSDSGPELWQAHLRSLVLNNEFDDALSVLNSVDGISEELLIDSTNDTFEAIFQNSEDLPFLKYFFYEVPKMQEKLRSSTLLLAAERVLKMGLPDASLTTLEEIQDPELFREIQVAKAKALISLSRPEEAEILLIGLKGENVALLRALARSKMGDHEYARAIYDELGEETSGLTQAWLSGNWGRVSEQKDDPLSSAAQFLSQERVTPSFDDIDLEEIERLQAQSSDVRATILNMLDATELASVN
ncbi:MAG: hypothetical protein ACRBB0_02995 [Pelagimonas sp.]|uniref:hypothetical protein n=1 Tax=Pelagimonas sp. TaxID=2073170 RepID=UPI003D6A0D4A